jgi:hypothetical protein
MATPSKKQAFKNIDLDITHYETDELLAMLNLTDPTEDDIMNATNRLINKANADRLPQVAAFFQDAQDALLDELDKQSPPEEEADAPDEEEADAPNEDEEEGEPDAPDANEAAPQDPDQEDNTDANAGAGQLGQWWRNEYLKQDDKAQADKPTERKNKIQVLQGNQHMPTKREKLGVNETFQVPVAQGTLNPNLKNTVTRLVNLDSQYRQIIMPNSENPLGPASPTNYTVDLTENLTNVLSIKLNSVQIPYAWYAIDYTSGTNVLFYKLTTDSSYTPFVVEPGNYTPSQLKEHMSSVYPFNGTIFSIAYGANDGKFRITNVSAYSYDILFFDPTYHVPVTPSLMTSDINDAIAASKLNSNLGWLMGFRGTNMSPVVPNALIYSVFPNIWVTAGQGANVLAYSSDGNTWTASANGNAIFTQCDTVAWNGQMWVAGGSGITTLAYSLDGINWIASANGISIISTQCSTVAWNGQLWVAGGQGTNTLAYSSDGNTWFPSASGTATITPQCSTVAWSGQLQLWVAGGQGTNRLAYSSDGTTWIASANGNVIFTTECSTVAWSGQLQRWVAGGQGTNRLAYSSDGNTWTASANGNTTFTTECSTVAWSGQLQRWVAGGQGTNVLAYSSDGINWIASANGNAIFTTECSTVAWNGQRWVAGGQGTNTLAYSSDGKTWIASANGNATFSSVNAVASEEHVAIVAEALADTYGTKYLILVLDDYNQNHLNKGLVTIAANDTKLSMPSYFTPGLPVISDDSNNPFYVQSSPRQLTQAQIYTINTINQTRNNTTIDRYTGPTTTDVLALIPVKTFSLKPGEPYIEFGSSLQTNERIYFGPVNIERMKIQLIDDKGNILNMHGNDWSFTIVSTHLYEY